MLIGWRRLAGVAVAGLALTLCPLAALADDRADCNSLDGDVRIRSCSAIIDAGTGKAKDLAWVYSNRGVAYDGKGDIDQAIKDYDRAIELDPKYANAYSNRGGAYAGKGETGRAIKDFGRAIALDPKFSEAYANRAGAYVIKGDTGRALKDLDRAIELDPEQSFILNLRCWVRAVAGTKLAGARRDCDAALALVKNEPGILRNRGLVGIKQGQFDKAWADYDAVDKAVPGDASVLYGRGIAALRLGRTAEGKADLAAAMKLDGTIAETFAGYGVPPP